MESVIPHFNPEITFGSISIIVSLIFTSGTLYWKFASKVADHDKELADLRAEHDKELSGLRAEQNKALGDLRNDLNGTIERMVVAQGKAIDHGQAQVATLRQDLNEALAKMTAAHREALVEMKAEHKEMQADIKRHIVSNNDQHVAIMAAIADLKLGNAVASKDIDGMKEVMEQFGTRLNVISERQTAFLNAHLGNRLFDNKGVVAG